MAPELPSSSFRAWNLYLPGCPTFERGIFRVEVSPAVHGIWYFRNRAWRSIGVHESSIPD